MYPPALAQQLRSGGRDVVAVLEIEVGLAAKTDEDVLAWAARNNRCVVTENVSDFARLAQQRNAHSGHMKVTRLTYPQPASGRQRRAKALDEFLTAGDPPGRDTVAWLR
jgi:hypothetical protein